MTISNPDHEPSEVCLDWQQVFDLEQFLKVNVPAAQYRNLQIRRQSLKKELNEVESKLRRCQNKVV